MGKVRKLFSWLFAKRSRVILLALILVAGGAYYFTRKPKSTQTQQQTATVEKGTIVSSVSASGGIVSSNIENVTTQASGTVGKVYISDGDQVYKGQKIAEIELDVQGEQNYSSSYASYVSAVNSLKSAENNYRSTQASLAVVYDEIKGHDTDESFAMKETRTRAEVANDNAYDAVQTAKVRLTSASLSLATSTPTIVSPVSGTVKSVTIAEGMNIGATETASGSRANQRVVTIGTQGLPIATFDVSEIDVSAVEPGQKATVSIDSITDKTFTGKVVSVDRVGSSTNNVTSYPAIIQLDTNSDEILPNMSATANIITEVKNDVLIIPTSAIHQQSGQNVVTIIENGKEQTVNVETGVSSDTNTEIVSGLSEGQTVVVGSLSQSTTSQSGSVFSGSFGGGARIIGR